MLAYDDLLDGLGLTKTLLIGHSFGGLLACELAAQRCQAIEKLVLIAPIGLWLEDFPYTVADWCAVGPDSRIGSIVSPDAHLRHASVRER